MGLEQQLQSLAECGVVLVPEATLDDLFSQNSRQQYEAEPFELLIPNLGQEMSQEPYDHICLRLWMCDFERVEDDDAYEEVIKRLHQMSGNFLPITNIKGEVDYDSESAWIEFDLDGERIHWDAEFNLDWMDPDVVDKFDKLLKDHDSPMRFYSNYGSFGQCAFYGCFTPGEFEKFKSLAKFEIMIMEDHV